MSPSPTRSPALKAILIGGFIGGFGDWLFAHVFYAWRLGVFQNVAGGLMGRDAARAGGVPTYLFGVSLALGPTEFRLLRHFLEHPGRVFSRERLLDSVWGRDSDIEPRTVDVHIRRLRKAINLGDRPDLIRTVRSAGYALDAGKG